MSLMANEEINLVGREEDSFACRHVSCAMSSTFFCRLRDEILIELVAAVSVFIILFVRCY